MKKLVFFTFRAFCVFYKKHLQKNLRTGVDQPPVYRHDRKKYVFFDALPKTEVKLFINFFKIKVAYKMNL